MQPTSWTSTWLIYAGSSTPTKSPCCTRFGAWDTCCARRKLDACRKTKGPGDLPGPLLSHNTTKVLCPANTLPPIIDPYAVRIVGRGIASFTGDDAVAAEMFDAAPDPAGAEVDVRRDAFVASVVAHARVTEI